MVFGISIRMDKGPGRDQSNSDFVAPFAHIPRASKRRRQGEKHFK